MNIHLLKVLCTPYNINHNILKMISETFINCLSLICNGETIVKFVNTILNKPDDDIELIIKWRLADSVSNESIMKRKFCQVNCLPSSDTSQLDVTDIITLKITVASGICEQNLWTVVDFDNVNIRIIEVMCSYCCIKYVRHIIFAFQTLQKCLNNVTLKQAHILHLEHLEIVFEVILGNWENYLPSVLDRNLELSQCFINFMKQSNDEIFQKENFWKYLSDVSCSLKSKYYLMGVSFLADFYPEDVLEKSWFTENLAYSLTRSYLVTAGAYCYKILIKRVLTEEKWKRIFLQKVLDQLCHSNICIRQNVCNYWLPTTVKKFPAIINILYDLVNEKYTDLIKEYQSLYCIQSQVYTKNRNSDQLQRFLHSIILIIKLEKPSTFTKIKYDYIQNALKCSDELIRGDAFLCCQTFNGVKCLIETSRGDGKVQSCQTFNDIYTFLEENINCDDASLRQTIYKVFKNYVLNMESEMHKIVVPRKNHQRLNLPDSYYEICNQFAILHTFFINNLNVGGNYQRLITTLHLMSIILDNVQPHLNENQKKKRIPTIEVMKICGDWDFESATTRESLFNCLKDDTSDIRSMAKYLLRSYFLYEKSEFDVFVENLKFSFEMSSSNVFYTAESGAFCVSVLTHLFYKSYSSQLEFSKIRNLEELFSLNDKKRVESIVTDDLSLKYQYMTLTDSEFNSSSTGPPSDLFVTYLLKKCLVQAEILRKDILMAVKSGNSLHGSLTTLMQVLTDITSPEFCQLNIPNVQQLLNLLNETCMFLLDILCMKSKSTNFAPSFGEMGEAMNSIINDNDEDDNLTLSPAHQTLFNCIWMNLKVCCTFASEIAVAYNEKLSRDQIIFCCNIVSYVLHKCRHKGAIQNAGLALSNIVSKCLFKDSYPYDILYQTMNLVLDSTTGGTVSRKSAGVAILIHKIVASHHSMKDKMFKLALDKIIKVADSPVNPSMDTLKVDLPQATAFHMLQFLVADSGLRVQMFPYLERITLLCFDKMKSHEWTVRNAALQVFGVLLPKLVGTKKQDADNQISNLAFEEFFYQLPRIGDCLKSVFLSTPECNTALFVSALTLASRLKVTGKLFSSSTEQSKLKNILSNMFARTLSSNIHTIRYLSANCFVNYMHGCYEYNFQLIFFVCTTFIFGHQYLKHFPLSVEHFLVTNNFHDNSKSSDKDKKQLFDDFLEYIKGIDNNFKISDQNHVHGYLLTLEYLKDKMDLEKVKLSKHFVLEVLNFLSTTRFSFSKHSELNTVTILLKIFRHEIDEYQFTIDNKPIDVLVRDTIINRKEIGCILFSDEWVKFQMHLSVFGNKGQIDFNFICRLVKSVQHQPDMFFNSSKYLLHLLKSRSDLHLNRIVKQSSVFSKSHEEWENLYKHDYIKPTENLMKVFLETAISFNRKLCSDVVYKVIIELYNLFLLNPIIDENEEFDHLIDSLLKCHLHINSEREDLVVYISPLALPVVCICYLFTKRSPDSHVLTQILNTIDVFIYNENCNEDFRYAASKALSILFENNCLQSGSQQFRVCYKNVIHLLQDEVYEVRHEIIYLVRYLCLNHKESLDRDLLLKNPYVALISLLELKYIDVHNGMELLFEMFTLQAEDFNVKQDEFNNPFDHNIRNFYWESVEVDQRAKTKLVNLSRSQIYKSRLCTLFDTFRSKIEQESLLDLNERGKLKVSFFYELGNALLVPLRHESRQRQRAFCRESLIYHKK